MRLGGPRRAVAIVLAAALAGAGAACSEPSSGAGTSVGPGADSLIDWMAAHREDVGLVVVVDGEEKLAHQPDERFPLASTIKVLTLVAYAEQVAAGVLDPRRTVPVDEVDRQYLAGTDGGAHEAARSEWGDAEEVTLDQLAHATIRFSSNAAADVLLDEVGGPPAALEAARRHGMSRQTAPVSIADLFRSWKGSRDSVRKLAAESPAGTPREWASLMEQVRTGRNIPAPAAAVVRKHLQWPMSLGDNSRSFESFGTKGGALPGIITEASYLVPRDGRPTSVSLFLRDLPDDVYAELRRSYAHQELIRALATQPDVLTELAARLAG